MKTPPVNDLKVLLKKYQLGKCTAKEMSMLTLWMEQLDVRDHDHIISDTALQEMQDRMYHNIMNRQAIRSARVVYICRRASAAAAAILFIAVVTGWLLTQHRQASPAIAMMYQRIENPGKNVKKITMPDGTHVWLNSAAVLEIDPAFNARDRKVKLEGEAFFEVTKDQSHPFVVATGQLETKVLGTSFNVEAYGLESEIRVSLLTGSVQIENKDITHKTLLHPGEMVRYKKASGTMQVLPIAAQHIQGWITGGMVFNEVPLPDALQRLEQRYGIHIVYDHQLVANKRVTAFCSGQENWPAILKTMLFVHDLDFYQRADTIYIKR